MINVRCHAVALTAAFFALAIGLVVGTAALNGPVADSLRDRVNQLKLVVDNVDTPQGRLVTVWAVADQIRGRTGHYGIGAGAPLVPKTTQ